MNAVEQARNASIPESFASLDTLPTLKTSWAYRWRILISAASLLTCVALIALLEPLPRLAPSERLTLLATGWFLLTGGIAIRLWAASCLGGKKTAQLIRVGPYSLCRNPLYVGTLFIALSQVFFFQSVWFLAGLAIPLLIYATGVVPAEEKKLRARLGESYIEYCDQVPRWWPHFGGYVAPAEHSRIRTRSFRQEVKRSIVWLALPMVAAAVTTLRSVMG